MNPLQSRLAALRRRLCLVVLSRGVGTVLVLVLAGALAAMGLDWYLNLPGLVRAFLLVGILAGAGFVAFQYLFAPLASRMDDLTLALRVEEQYPALNDALASTVQFLQQPGDAALGDSSSMRREAVQRAMRVAQGCDFNSVIDRRGLGLVTLASVLLVAGTSFVFLSYPLAPTALARLLEPFADHTWTTLNVEPCPTRVAQKRPYVIRGKVAGVMPGTVNVEIEGQGVKRVQLKPDDDGWTTASFSAPLDMTKQQGEFRFRVVANDASFPAPAGAWHKVQVVPPPRLTLLDGRQSPQIEYQFPAYTELPSPLYNSPGTKSIDVYAGTEVIYRAAVDRPIEKAWIEFRPRDEITKPALALGTIAAPDTRDALTRLVGGHAVWGKVLPQMSGDRRRLTFAFQPWVTGTYALRLEDADALVLDDEADLRVQADPIPQVYLLKPSGKQTLLPTATVPLHVVAEDDLFGLRTVFLEVRRRDRDGKVEAMRRVPLFDHHAAREAIAQVFAAFAPLLPPPAQGPRRVVEIGMRWPLAGIAKEGDILYLQACADDFNNVSPFNPPGRSIEVELHIIGKTELAKILDDRLADVQKDLVNVQKMQDQAAKAVRKVQDDLKKDKKLDPKDQEKLLDRLIEAEQTQKQIQKQVGAKPDEGLRDKLAKLQQMLRDNQMPPSNVQDRVRTLNNELERLAQEDFPQIEQKLAEARKELNAKLNGKETPSKKDNPLDKAGTLQEDAKRAIDDLVRFLDPWANMHQVKTQAQELLDRQRDLKKETQNLEDQRRQAAPEDIAKAAENQQQLADRLQDLLNRMKEVGDKRMQEGDKQTANQLKDAAAEAAKNQIDKAMKDAKANLNQKNPIDGKPMPQHGQAMKNQQKAIDGLEKMIAAMGDRRDEDVEKRLREQMAAEAALADLLKKQEDILNQTKKKLEEQDLLAKNKKQIEDELKKKKRDPAEAKADLAKIEAGMKQNQADLNKLAQQQRELQKLVQEKARELARMQAPQAGKALAKAAQEMERAAQMLEKGENAEEPQQEARDLLEDAQDQLQEAQEELLREQLAKIADKLKGLKERQDAAVKEMIRLHGDSVEKQQRWTAGQLRSLGDLGEAQKAISRETESLKEKLKGAKVFERILERAAKNMDDAVETINNRREKGRTQRLDDEELADENKAQELTLKHQTDASKRLQRLLDALKEEQLAKRPQQKKKDPKNGGQQEENKLGGPGDGIPDIAQLKALREEQQELNDRTRAFVERQMAILVAGGGAVTPAPLPGDATPMTPAQRTELSALEAEQAGLRELFDLITRPPQRGEKEEQP